MSDEQPVTHLVVTKTPDKNVRIGVCSGDVELRALEYAQTPYALIGLKALIEGMQEKPA